MLRFEPRGSPCLLMRQADIRSGVDHPIFAPKPVGEASAGLKACPVFRISMACRSKRYQFSKLESVFVCQHLALASWRCDRVAGYICSGAIWPDRTCPCTIRILQQGELQPVQTLANERRILTKLISLRGAGQSSTVDRGLSNAATQNGFTQDDANPRA